MGLGLLGALQGAGQSMTQFGNALFAEETERRRQADLQAIRDSDYNRARSDQLADIQTGFDRQDALTADNRQYDAGLLEDATALYDERLETAEGLVDDRYDIARRDYLKDDLRNRNRQLTDIAKERGWQMEDRKNTYSGYQVDDTGTVIAFNAEGESQEVGQLANMNPILNEALDAYQYTIRQIDMMGATREDDPELFNSLDRYQDLMNAGFASSAENMGLDIDVPMSTEEAIDLGRLLFNGQNEVNDNGTIRSGQELIDARLNFRQQYPSLLELIQGPK